MFLIPLVRAIDELAFAFGVWPELTAQNFFLVFRGDETLVLWRDFQGFFRDANLMATLGLADPAPDFSYHSIVDEKPKPWRSYLFDSLLERHVVGPILAHVRDARERREIVDALRGEVSKTLISREGLLPELSFDFPAVVPKMGQRLALRETSRPTWR